MPESLKLGARVRFGVSLPCARTHARDWSEAVVLTQFAGVGDWSSLFSPLLGRAENEKRLRVDAVVLHGIRGGLALHDLLEGLDVRDLGDERSLLGSARVPERPNGDAH